jgi:hypothetical protein
MSLAIVANSLAKKKVLCKSLMTVETLGACDTLLSDKTGSKCRHYGIGGFTAYLIECIFYQPLHRIR